MRDKIAKIVWDGAIAEDQDRCDQEFDEFDYMHLHYQVADAIIAALPEIIADLKEDVCDETE